MRRLRISWWLEESWDGGRGCEGICIRDRRSIYHLEVKEAGMDDQTPCLSCERKEKDKNRCAMKCERRRAFLDGEEWPGLPIPVIEEEVEEAKDEHQPKAVAPGGASNIKKQGKRICEVDGCDKTVKASGKCNKHYLRWTRGKLPGYPRGKRKVKPKPKAKRQRPKAGGKVVETLPESQIVVDLSRYPALRDKIFIMAQRFFVTPEHVLMGLAGEAMAMKRVKTE